MSIVLKVEKLDPDLETPSYAHTGDAAFDLYSKEKVVLKPGKRFSVPTGLAIEIPDGYVGLVWDKSSIGIVQGIKTLGGVIDSTYRGEILVGVINLSEKEYIFERGDKIAQMIIQKKEEVNIEVVDSLSKTNRGIDGFGSSGK